MEAADQQYMYKIVFSIDWILSWLESTTTLDTVGYRKAPQSAPRIYLFYSSQLWYIPTSHLLEIHLNIIHQSKPRSPQWSPSLLFPQQDPIHPPLLTHTRHMPSPSHSSRFFITRTILGEEYKSFSSSLCIDVHLPTNNTMYLDNNTPSVNEPQTKPGSQYCHSIASHFTKWGMMADYERKIQQNRKWPYILGPEFWSFSF